MSVYIFSAPALVNKKIPPLHEIRLGINAYGGSSDTRNRGKDQNTMKPEDRKAVILECAKRLFSKNGYFATQISDIIEEAGIARGTVYQYFKNKDDIFITLLEDYYAKWEKVMEEIDGDLDLVNITARQYLEYRIRKNLKFFADDRDLCNILLRMGLGLPGHLEGVVRRFETRILNVTIKDFELGQRNGHVKPGLDLELAANLFSGALLRAAYYYFGRTRKNAAIVDVENATRQIAEIIAPGIFVPDEFLPASPFGPGQVAPGEPAASGEKGKA